VSGAEPLTTRLAIAATIALVAIACRRETAIRPVSSESPKADTSVAPAPGPPPPSHVEITAVIDGPSPAPIVLAAGESISAGCARLLAGWPEPIEGARVVCGPTGPSDSFHPVAEVRGWIVARAPILATADFENPEVWYDEDTLPLHAHVVVQVREAAMGRLETFVKQHPKGQVAVLIDGEAEQVQEARLPLDSRRWWITPHVPIGGVSNEPVANAIASALGWKKP
jgi:hypothetical protein